MQKIRTAKLSVTRLPDRKIKMIIARNGDSPNFQKALIRRFVKLHSKMVRRKYLKKSFR